jgi:hypothetical protein
MEAASNKPDGTESIEDPAHTRRQLQIRKYNRWSVVLTVIGIPLGFIITVQIYANLQEGIARNKLNHTVRSPVHLNWVFISLTMIILVAGLATILYSLFLSTKDNRERLARLRAESLPERAKHAARVLQEATTLVEELQAELTARTALLEDVRRQAVETSQRIADMQQLSHVDDETTRILNKYFDEALKHRLDDLEHGSRRREWLIGLPIALTVGIIAILFAHYILGF